VLLCEHASNRLPCRVADPGLRGVLGSHWGWDIGGWALTRELSRRLRAVAIGGRFSRLWIDLNRRVDDPTLVRREAGGVALPWNRSAGAREIERRMLDCHCPYHAEVDRLVLRHLTRGVRPLLLSVHTFTPVLAGRPRRFDVGVLYDRHEAAARALGRALDQAGFAMRYNEPYSGLAGMMYAVDRHGSHHRLPCLELEVNQRTFERPALVLRLARVVARAVEALVRQDQSAAATREPRRAAGTRSATGARPARRPAQLPRASAARARKKQRKKPTTKPWA
jgi:predicted N-formylglutamate amidohydrolase